MIEREPELAAAEQAIADARDGNGNVVFFVGTTGSGKTHLLDGIHSAARGTVLRARGHVSETTLAYGLVRQLFDDLLDELSPLERERLFEGPAGAALPLLGRGGPPGGGVVDPDLAARHGVWKLLQAIAGSRGPVVALVDDLQWADPESALALGYCANRLGGAPVALVCAGRDRELPDAAAAILDAATPHSLAALSEAGCARLVEELMPGALGAFADACHAATEGLPQLVVELVKAARAEGMAPDEAGADQLRGLVPESITRVVRARLARRSEAAVALARALAVLDRAPLHLAAAVAGLDERAAQAAVAELEGVDAIDDALPLRLAHPIIASAIYEDLSLAAREGLHRDAAARLREQDPEVAAGHLLRCEARREGWGADTLRAAARLAMGRGAPAAGARLLAAAAERLPHERDGELDLERGMAELTSGSPLPAVEHLERALSVGVPSGARTAARMALAQARLMSSDPAGGVAELRATVESTPADDPLEGTLFHVYTGLARLRADSAADARARLAERAETEPVASATRALLAQDAFLAAGPATSVAEHARAALSDPRLIFDGPVGAPHQLATWALAATDELDAAAAAARAQADVAERTGSAFRRGLAAQLQTQIALRRGRLDEVRAASERALELARSGWPYVGAAASRARALALVAAGHAERAAAAIAEGRTLAVDAEGEPDHTWLHLADAELALARGDHGEALAAAQRCGEAAAAMLVSNPVLLPWRSVALRAALALGERDRATELAEDESALARSFGTATAVGAALHSYALTGPPGERSERLSEAAAWLAPSGSQLLHAHALADLGTSLRRDRRERDAREPLRRAVAGYRACDADALADAADAELRAAGGRPRREAVEGTGALTAAERRIADLAAAGRSNPQIASELVLTRRTVETHLTSIYRKLDIEGRERLAAGLAEG